MTIFSRGDEKFDVFLLFPLEEVKKLNRTVFCKQHPWEKRRVNEKTFMKQVKNKII